MNTMPSHEAINQCMLDGGYPIIKIDIGKGVNHWSTDHWPTNHWVVIVGKSNEDYYIRDPRISTPNGEPITLSSRSDYIYAARCVTPNED